MQNCLAIHVLFNDCSVWANCLSSLACLHQCLGVKSVDIYALCGYWLGDSGALSAFYFV